MSLDTSTDLEQIERDFPAWTVWRATGSTGEPGDWYASRRRRITPEQMRAGLWATVYASSLEKLREVLVAQTEIATRVTA